MPIELTEKILRRKRLRKVSAGLGTNSILNRHCLSRSAGGGKGAGKSRPTREKSVRKHMAAITTSNVRKFSWKDSVFAERTRGSLLADRERE